MSASSESPGAANSTEWTSLSKLDYARSGPCAVVVNDHQFLVIGGFYYSYKNSGVYYDANDPTGWKKFPVDMPGGREFFGIATIDNRLYVLGGKDDWRDGGHCLSDVISIDISGGDLSAVTGRNWESSLIPPLPRARECFSCVSHSTFLYVFGGAGHDTDSAIRCDTKASTPKWETLPRIPGGPRHQCVAAVIGNRIFVVGGLDNDKNNLASTIVFDVSQQKWETSGADADANSITTKRSVPDMEIARRGFVALAIDHFVLVIGGLDQAGNKLLSSEVLDTQRNVWKPAPKYCKGRFDFAAGYLRQTKQVIVAGGSGNDTAEIVHFESGLLPDGLKFKERGQDVQGDTARGKDLLGLKIIAEALAEALVLQSLGPPFVLGVLGKWGRGKSYFFNLMLDYLVKIQLRRVDDDFKEAFAGHIYVVKFDAWTFSKGNIWSSMMYQILKELNEQLQFEAEVGEEALLNGDVSTIEVFRDLSDSEIKYVKKNKDICQAIKKNGDLASHRLLEAIDEHYEKDREKLDNIREKIRQERRRIQAVHTLDEMRASFNFLGKWVLNKLVMEANKIKISVDDETSGSIDRVMNFIELMSYFGVWIFGFQFSNIPSPAIICTVLLIALMIVLFAVYGDKINGLITSLLGGLAGLTPFITSIMAAKKKIDPIVSELKNQATALNGDLESQSSDDGEGIKKLMNKKMEIEDRVLALEGCSLRETISKKVDANEYENNLGIVHKVQRDIKALSDGMLNKRKKEIFHRGVPRIILFVDDLDRCDQDVVVEVIEALQLLVKEKLFVAILAIDPRYVCLSLEEHYKGILHPNNPPTGMDFLEKIIQIPFRLPEIGKDNFRAFLRNQIKIEKPKRQDDSKIVQPALRTSSDTSDAPPASLVQTDSISEKQDVQEEQDEVRLVGGFIPKDLVMFEEVEGVIMEEVLELFGVGPRCLRRIINVFKVLKVVWKRDDRYRVDKDLDLQRATLFLMLLASDESTRVVTQTIFEWMELGMVKYHLVAPRDGKEMTLAKLFETELQKHDSDIENSFDEDGNAMEGTILFYIDKYLANYKWSKFSEWRNISFLFVLARSFSFFRLVTEEMNLDSLPRQKRP